jgi:hypothetical protein
MILQRSLLSVTAIALIFAAAGVVTSEAAKAGKGKRGQLTPEQALARFDRDGDGTLSAQEAERVKAFYAALKQLDKDNDGKLSDSEIAAVKPAAHRAGKKKAQ